MSTVSKQEITRETIGPLNIEGILPPEAPLRHPIVKGIRSYTTDLLRHTRGGVDMDTFSEFAAGVAEYEGSLPLYSAQPYRYQALAELEEHGTERTAESTVLSAIANQRFLVARFGAESFAAKSYKPRNERELEWQALIDDDFALRFRGGSGAGTFSLDIGLGMIDHSKMRPPQYSYRELWRTGIDTAHTEGGTLGTRFIRTGTAVKPGDKSYQAKYDAFQQFRKRYGVLPQRLLSLAGLYVMREFEPDYALAPTVEGAMQFSTLGTSKGSCDYTGIFKNVGFEPGDDRFWLQIPHFQTGFYDALEKAGIRKKEASALDRAVDAINSMQAISADHAEARLPLALCSNEDPETLGREIFVHMPKPALAY